MISDQLTELGWSYPIDKCCWSSCYQGAVESRALEEEKKIEGISEPTPSEVSRWLWAVTGPITPLALSLLRWDEKDESDSQESSKQTCPGLPWTKCLPIVCLRVRITHRTASSHETFTGCLFEPIYWPSYFKTKDHFLWNYMLGLSSVLSSSRQQGLRLMSLIESLVHTTGWVLLSLRRKTSLSPPGRDLSGATHQGDWGPYCLEKMDSRHRVKKSFSSDSGESRWPFLAHLPPKWL